MRKLDGNVRNCAHSLNPVSVPYLTSGDKAESFQALVEDIRENGQRDPIDLLEGMIIDGRNRYKACRVLGVEPISRHLEDISSPVHYVLSKNCCRRHLKQSQLAAIGAESLPMLEQEARERQSQLNRPLSSLAHPCAKLETGRSSEAAAQSLGGKVGYRSIEQAKAVKERDPELFEKLKEGKTGVKTAYNKVRQDQPDTFKKTKPWNGEKGVSKSSANFPKSGVNARFERSGWVVFPPLPAFLLSAIHVAYLASYKEPAQAVRVGADFQEDARIRVKL